MRNNEKYELPEVPLHIHNMIQQEVEKQINVSKTIDFDRKKKGFWNKRRMAIALIAGVLTTSTIAFAGTSIFGIHARKEGKYGIFLGIEDPEKNIVELPEKVCGVHYEAGYIPEGMYAYQENQFYFEGMDYIGGISIFGYLMDQKDIGKEVLEKGVIESEEIEYAGRSGIYVKYLDLKEDGTMDKRIYLLCPEAQRVIVIYCGDNVSKEDSIKFAENLKITNTEDMLVTEGMLKWSGFLEPKVYRNESIYEVRDNKIKTLHIGDTVEICAPHGDSGATTEVSVSLDRLVVADDFDMLQKEFIPEEWYDLLDEDGKLRRNHLCYVKRGNGINTLDKVVGESYVNQKIVYATLTYTNLSNVKANQLMYHGNLLYIKHEDKKCKFYEPFGQGKGYDYILADGLPGGHWWSYFRDEKDQVNESNYIESLEAGESIQVELAWIVNENDLKNLYLNVNDSTNKEYSESMTSIGIYKLTD